MFIGCVYEICAGQRNKRNSTCTKNEPFLNILPWTFDQSELNSYKSLKETC